MLSECLRFITYHLSRSFYLLKLIHLFLDLSSKWLQHQDLMDLLYSLSNLGNYQCIVIQIAKENMVLLSQRFLLELLLHLILLFLMNVHFEHYQGNFLISYQLHLSVSKSFLLNHDLIFQCNLDHFNQFRPLCSCLFPQM